MKKKRRSGLMVSTFLCLLAIPLFLLCCGFLLPEQYGDSFLGELKEKCARLEETEGKRIVLVGGSGVAFGYDSTLLSDAFPDYEVVNFGMYAGLGTKVMLDLSVDRIREGDLVILSPEQENQTLSCYFDGDYVWQAADGDFSLLLLLDRENGGEMVSAFPHFAMEKLRYFLAGERPQPDEVYRKASFDEAGDIRPEICPANVMPQQYDTNTPVSYTEAVMDASFVEELNEYAEALRKKGATVWYRFCPVNRLAVEDETQVADYAAWLAEQLDFPVIGDPEESVMDAAWFFDTNFHLNASGKRINTVAAIRDIKEALGVSEADGSALVDATWAEAETQAETEAEAETEAGADQYFTWEESDGQAILTGLTDAGRQQESLTIPVSFGGLPVRVLPADVFSGDTIVKEVVIPEGIESLADGAFSGCSSLGSIVIEDRQPSDVRPGQKLLEGTDALLYVERDVLSAYRLNYFWSVYADRLKSKD
jgi:hypothetical protein